MFEDIKVECVDKMGSDLTVVNAARVSMDKFHYKLEPNDENLIRYLAEHNHWSPFAHAMLQLRIKAPIFVARQLVKHQVGLVFNECSRRYVDSDPTFYLTELRERAENVKQGSRDVLIELGYNPIKEASETAIKAYKQLLEANVAPEVARSVLPLNTMTEWIWTGSLYAFVRVVKLRTDSHAQKEARIVAERIKDILKAQFPLSYKYLIGIYEENESFLDYINKQLKD